MQESTAAQLHEGRAAEAQALGLPHDAGDIGTLEAVAAEPQAQLIVEVAAGTSTEAEARTEDVPQAGTTGVYKNRVFTGTREETAEVLAAMWRTVDETQAYWAAKAVEQAAAKKLADQQAAERRRETARWAKELRRAAAQVAEEERKAAALRAARATQPVSLERKNQ